MAKLAPFTSSDCLDNSRLPSARYQAILKAPASCDDWGRGNRAGFLVRSKEPFADPACSRATGNGTLSSIRPRESTGIKGKNNIKYEVREDEPCGNGCFVVFCCLR